MYTFNSFKRSLMYTKLTDILPKYQVFKSCQLLQRGQNRDRTTDSVTKHHYNITTNSLPVSFTVRRGEKSCCQREVLESRYTKSYRQLNRTRTDFKY